MPSIVVRTTTCAALLAAPILVLAQGSILPQPVSYTHLTLPTKA